MTTSFMLSSPSTLKEKKKLASMIVVGAQWGDEGKGKVIDYLSQRAHTIVRTQGGNNAGHTVIVGEEEYKLHLVPSGILCPSTQCYLGGGVVIDPQVFLQEVRGLEKRGIRVEGRLWLSPYAHVIMPYHRLKDVLVEEKKGKDSVGTTKRGIGPCYADKANRVGFRISDLLYSGKFKELLFKRVAELNEELIKIHGQEPLSFSELLEEYSHYAKELQPFVHEFTESQINEDLYAGKSVLFEGAQGALLDNTFGTFPYVTSSSTLAGGICTGAAVGPTKISHTVAVCKAYTTRVGSGPMPTELFGEDVFIDVEKDREMGTTTGRSRRIGWFDAVLLKTSLMMNGADSIALMKLDVLDHLEEIKICVGYLYRGKVYEVLPGSISSLDEVLPVYKEMEGWVQKTTGIREYKDLPLQARNYIETIEEVCQMPLSLVSVGPAREQTILLESDWPI